MWIAGPEYSGPVLVRGRRLDGEGTLLFQVAAPNHSPASAKRSLVVEGQHVALYRELMLTDTGEPVTTAEWREWPSATFTNVAGCYAWQIDGTTFTEVIVAESV